MDRAQPRYIQLFCLHPSSHDGNATPRRNGVPQLHGSHRQFALPTNVILFFTSRRLNASVPRIAPFITIPPRRRHCLHPSSSSSSSSSRKRKSSEGPRDLPRNQKRARSAKPNQKSRKRASPDPDDDWGSDSGDIPSQPLIYRSRSTSAVQCTAGKTRNCAIEADGDPAKTPHVSSLNAVKDLMRTYKACTWQLYSSVSLSNDHGQIFQTPKTQKTTRGSHIPFTLQLANSNTQIPMPAKSLFSSSPKTRTITIQSWTSRDRYTPWSTAT